MSENKGHKVTDRFAVHLFSCSYLRKSASICGSFVVRVHSRAFAVTFAFFAPFRGYPVFVIGYLAERVSFELVNGFFDAAGARFWGLGTFDRYDDRLFFAMG